MDSLFALKRPTWGTKDAAPKPPSALVAYAIERVSSAAVHLLAAQKGQALATLYAVTAMSAAQEMLKGVQRAGVADTQQVQNILSSGLAVCKQQTTSSAALHDVETSLRQMLPALHTAYEQLKQMEEPEEDLSDFLIELLQDVPPGSADHASV